MHESSHSGSRVSQLCTAQCIVCKAKRRQCMATAARRVRCVSIVQSRARPISLGGVVPGRNFSAHAAQKQAADMRERIWIMSTPNELGLHGHGSACEATTMAECSSRSATARLLSCSLTIQLLEVERRALATYPHMSNNSESNARHNVSCVAMGEGGTCPLPLAVRRSARPRRSTACPADRSRGCGRCAALSFPRWTAVH